MVYAVVGAFLYPWDFVSRCFCEFLLRQRRELFLPFSAALRGAPGNDFWASLVEGPVDAVKALEFSDACGSVGEVFGVGVFFVAVEHLVVFRIYGKG